MKKYIGLAIVIGVLVAIVGWMVTRPTVIDSWTPVSTAVASQYDAAKNAESVDTTSCVTQAAVLATATAISESLAQAKDGGCVIPDAMVDATACLKPPAEVVAPIPDAPVATEPVVEVLPVVAPVVDAVPAIDTNTVVEQALAPMVSALQAAVTMSAVGSPEKVWVDATTRWIGTNHAAIVAFVDAPGEGKITLTGIAACE